MLVLTRKVHQSILIRDDIVVEVLGVDRGRVKLGVSAPRDVTILRQELSPPPDNGGTQDTHPGGASATRLASGAE
ncbi:MAG TPA: carbon storage regulator [Rubrobacteraceae bacterium]|nr:carbon storage regulator [Rubrobacteraceae bacterium]